MSGEYLRVVEGPASGAVIPIIGEQEFGQKAGQLGTLGSDPLLAAHHARVSRLGTGELALYDVASGGQIHLNGQSLTSAVVLTPGDRIQMGNNVLEVVAPTPTEQTASASESVEPYAALAGEPASEIPPAPDPLEGLLAGTTLSRFAPTISRHLPPTLKGRVFPGAAGLLVQLVVGWEWIISGATKIKNGDFPSGLAANIRMNDDQAAHWYKSFLNDVMIPHAKLFGYLIESFEVVIGVIILATALLWLWRWEHLRAPTREWLLALTIFACLAGVFMNVNFFLTSGANLPFFLAKDSFGEGVGLDVLLPYLEVIIIAIALWTLLSIRRFRLAQAVRQDPGQQL